MSHDPIDLLQANMILKERADSCFRLALAMLAMAIVNGMIATWALMRLFGGQS
mgnify:CR=1 FL=1